MDLIELELIAMDPRISDTEYVKKFTDFCLSIEGEGNLEKLLDEALDTTKRNRPLVYQEMKKYSQRERQKSEF